MDFGKFLGGIFGGIFGGNKDEEERRRQQQAQNANRQQRPASAPNMAMANPGAPKMPSAFALPGVTPEPQQQKQAAPKPVIAGGVTQAPKLDQNEVNKARDILKSGGAGAPLRPEVLNEARRQNEAARPKAPTLNTNLNLSGWGQNPSLNLTQKPPVVRPKTEDDPDDRPFLEKVGAGIQQAGGRVLDVAVQGGTTLSQLGNMTNPFLNDEQRQARINETNAVDDYLRGGVNSMKDISGDAIIGNRDVDAAAARIANGQGSAQDFATVGGRGLDIAGTATMLLNPARTLTGAAVGGGKGATVAGLKQLAPFIGREAALYGGLEGTTASVENYGQTGDIMQALAQFAPNALLGAASQAGLEVGAFAGGRAINGVAGNVARVADGAMDTFDEAYLRSRFADNPAAGGVMERPVVPEYDKPIVNPEFPKVNETPGVGEIPVIPTPAAPRDPSSPITQSPTTNKPPAITSPNRPIEAPVPQGVQQPQALMPEVEAPRVPTPDEAAAAIQKQIDDAANQAPEQPPVIERTVLEAPTTAQSRTMAAEATPVNTQAVEEAVQAQKTAEAPTETIADDVDPRVKQADSLADELISTADRELKAEGGSYSQVVRKLYNNNRKDGTPTNLSAAERKVADRIKPELDRVLSKMNELGLTDADMGMISDYLPTTKFDDMGDIKNVSDIEGQDFGFTKTRGNNLDDAQVEQGAEQALRNYLRTGSMLDDLSPEIVGKVKLARRDKEFVDMIEKDVNGGDTGLRLSDEEINTARTQNQKLIAAEEARVAAEKKVAAGDNSDATISELNKTQQEVSDAYIDKQVNDYITLERKTDAQIKAIRESTEMTSETKKQRITQLESHLTDVRNQTYYLQSTTRTNMLFGVGRIADQVNKGVQSTADSITRGSKIGANKSFKNSTGRNLFADSPTTNAVWKKVQKNPAVHQGRTNAKIAKGVLKAQDANKGIVGKIFGGYRMAGTRVTEAGSRYRIAAKDTTSYFISKAKAEGITDVNKITEYVNNAVGGAEWNRVHTGLFEARNTFTGLPNAGQAASKDMRLNVRTAIYNKLGNIPGMSRNARENVADGLTIPVIGFPRLIYRLGVRGLDNATLGAGDFLKAATIKPKNEADALKKALLVQQGLRAAQNGATLGAVGVALGAAGMTTGAYPEDAAERARWEKDKIQPFSLKLGDQYVDIGRYAGPLAFPLMIGASVGRGQATPTELAGLSGELTKQFLANYGADSIGDILSTAGNVLKGDFDSASKDLNRIGAGMVSAFIPGSSALNTAGKTQDIVQGDAAPDGSDNIIDAVRSRLPVVRDGLPEKTDNLGNPISQGNGFNLLPGISGGQDTNRAKTDKRADTVMSEIDRLAGLDFEVMPSKDIKNSNSQEDAKLLMDSKTYKESDDETKAGYIKEALLGTKAKDISKDLSPERRMALLEHKLMSEDKRKAWLDSNENAANYYDARYENLKANKTLTSDDENLQKKDGAKYKALEARVNKEVNASPELETMYEQISQSEFKNMLDPEHEDYNQERAQMLFKYDEARTKLGVSRNESSDKPKYSLKFDLKSAKGGRGSRANGGNFAFASLPGSLIGTGSDGGGKYANDAPTFKPVADLKAPEGKVIPKGRTISVKKGIVI